MESYPDERTGLDGIYSPCIPRKSAPDFEVETQRPTHTTGASFFKFQYGRAAQHLLGTTFVGLNQVVPEGVGAAHRFAVAPGRRRTPMPWSWRVPWVERYGRAVARNEAFDLEALSKTTLTALSPREAAARVSEYPCSDEVAGGICTEVAPRRRTAWAVEAIPLVPAHYLVAGRDMEKRGRLPARAPSFPTSPLSRKSVLWVI